MSRATVRFGPFIPKKCRSNPVYFPAASRNDRPSRAIRWRALLFRDFLRRSVPTFATLFAPFGPLGRRGRRTACCRVRVACTENGSRAVSELKAHFARRSQRAVIQYIPVRVLRLIRVRMGNRPTRQLRAGGGCCGQRYQRCADQTFKNSHRRSPYGCDVRSIRASDRCCSVERASC